VKARKRTTHRQSALKEPTHRHGAAREDRLGRLYAALSATNEAILRAKSPEELYQRVCDAAVHGGKFAATTVLLADPGEKWVRMAGTTGVSGQVFRELRISVDETIPEGRGLVGTAFRTQRPCITNDYLNDPRLQPWYLKAREQGWNSATTLPLIRGGRSVGVLAFYAFAKDEFDVELVQELERLGENVSFALEKFEQESERKLAEERVQHMATHDGLTSLPNRLMFSRLLNHAIQSASRYGHRFAVLFIDLDRFKIVNDTLGHEAGDELLREVSLRLIGVLRASDVVARLGGDEFVIMVQEVSDPEQVASVARKILSAIIEPVVVRGQECRVTGSVGICMYPAGAQEEHSLMKNADIAMYHAKEQGKNNFQFFSEPIKQQSLERLTLETSLRHALERKQMSMHYQAKVNFKTGAISGVEALLRWQHPHLGMVPPAQFIPVAEETGLIIPIGRWVLQTTCAQNMAWQRAGLPPMCMAVNLSARQFSDENLLSDVAESLECTGMPPELLELEITEGMVMRNIERTIKLLAAIKKMGVRLAIDDFGTGYSSLAQIKRFPIDTLKVDRSFISEIAENPGDRAITQAIIAMGKTLSLTVVAEGVETREQETFLREHACDEIQGYYFSKPIPADQFAELLRQHVPAP